MGIVKTKQKKEGSFDSHLIDSVLSIYPTHAEQKKSRRARRNETQSWIRILRQANSILEFTRPLICLGEKDGASVGEGLKEAAHALLVLAEGGRPAEATLGHCANFLGNIFKQDTGSYHWEWVGKVMAKRYPDALPPEPPKKVGGRDVGLWALNLAKRYRKLQADKAKYQKEMFRDSRGRLRKKLADHHPKTLTTIFPSLLKEPRAKFWPDELPSHVPEKCSMCLERAKRARGQNK